MDIRSRVCTVSFFGSDDFVPTGAAARPLEALVTLLLRGELFVEFLLGGTKAPPYGVDEGFLKLTTLPPGEAIA